MLFRCGRKWLKSPRLANVSGQTYLVTGATVQPYGLHCTTSEDTVVLIAISAERPHSATLSNRSTAAIAGLATVKLSATGLQRTPTSSFETAQFALLPNTQRALSVSLRLCLIERNLLCPHLSSCLNMGSFESRLGGK